MVLDIGGGLFQQKDVRETAGQFADLTLTAEAQGAVLYFNGTHWVVLTAGTDGHVLMAKGAGANVEWTNTVPIAAHAQDLVIASEAAGDVLYNDGSDWVRLAKGSDNEVLTLAAGLPSWAAASGGESQSNLIARNALKILLLEADGAVSSTDYTDLFADVYEDANGYNNLVDTGATTAFHTGTTYIRVAGGLKDNDNQEVADLSYSRTTRENMSWAITPATTYSLSYVIVKLKRSSAALSGNCSMSIFAADGSHIPTGGALGTSGTLDASTLTTSYAEKTFTFASPVALTGTTEYCLVFNHGTVALNDTNFIVAAATESGGSEVVGQEDDGSWTVYESDNKFWFKFYAIEGNLIQTIALTTTGSNISHMMVVTDGTQAGTTVDLSGDDGANYDTGKALGSKEAITDAGTKPIIKINLPASASTQHGFAVVLWTV